ncbi:hypothetical protein RIF29_24936 [Crotalaria pallida]|uniref:Uncharacterized protein n=1 Tax=Crotalaria pallida TaxID=3830 RepID=A0AAN9EL85_CROPI
MLASITRVFNIFTAKKGQAIYTDLLALNKNGKEMFRRSGEADEEVMDEEFMEEDETGAVNERELFAKVEAFIGKFCKQSNMQRDECFNL